ncbi:energy-coupling factor transporter transmembrane component T family protein [Butyrivibrio sp. WCD3002]|uniref:energy-coupling factor transporter transmembrane component T family protein n=1 Tax=Butyrivibrio sp. WCD3002 TaxID=1280676 RepID=UPI00041F7B16|nr:energy-coupling factor transporter transmembrane component T [Butyrivibrio sp. WCD3002]
MNRLISYEKKDTFVHKLSGFTKLVFFLIWCLTSALTFDTRILAIMLVLGILIYISAGIKWRQVSTIFKAVMFFMVINLTCIFFFSPLEGCRIYESRADLFHLFGNYTVTKQQLFYELNVLMKYFTVIPSVFIFLTTTDPSELASSLNGVGVPYKISYALEITLRYIPDIQDEFHRIKNAQEARGIEMSSKGKLLSRIKNTAAIIFPLLFSSMERIDVVSNAMELRGFGKKKTRTWYSRKKLTTADFAVLIFIIVFSAAALAFTYHDGNRFFNPFL